MSSRSMRSCSSGTCARRACPNVTRETRRGGRLEIARAFSKTVWNTWSFGAVEDVIRELRLAARATRRSIGYSLTVVLTLALGIGATVTIFSVIDHVLLRPLSYAHADRLVALYQHGTEGNQRLVSYPTLLDWSHADAGFSAMAYIRGDGLTLSTPDGPQTVGTGYVSPGFFKLMSTRPALGRTFTAEEEVQGGADAVVLSHDLWVRAFGADPHIVGRVVSLDSASANRGGRHAGRLRVSGVGAALATARADSRQRQRSRASRLSRGQPSDRPSVAHNERRSRIAHCSVLCSRGLR